MLHHHGLYKAWGLTGAWDLSRTWSVLLAFALCLISTASFGATVLNWSLDDGSGSIAADSAGQGNTGNVSGATWIPGRVGGALSFNGSNAALTRASVQGINTGNTPHTIAAWVKVNALPSGRAWIALLGPEGAGSHHWLLNNSGVTQLGAWNGGQVSPTLPVGVWKHLAITFDGSQLKGYIDGTLVGSQAASFNLTGTALTVAQSHVGEQYFNGEVDEFRVYNNALTAAEVSTLAGATPPALAISTSTLPNGTVGSNYSQTLAATGGTAPYTWSITAGSLPAGLSLNTTGTISGTPTAAGTSNVTVRVTDASNATADQPLSLTVTSTPPAALGLNIATDNTNEVYLNGVLLGTASNWTQSSNYSAALQSGTNVLAVKAIDTGGPAGLIAELTLPTGNVVSNASWKVSTTAPAGWEAVGFNDSAWSAASQYGPYGSGPWYSNVSGFPNGSSANWIWTADNNNDDTAYFRYTFTVGSAPPPTASLYYLYADHLNTPRVITDTGNTVVWRWDSDPFGTDAANEDPDGDGRKFRYNPRFPGQYFDKETGLHYNYFRDYEPGTGRYVQVDPIGIAGGLNVYSYANQNPVMFTDPLGLSAQGILPGIGSGAGTGAGSGAGIGEILGILGSCARAVTVIGGVLFPSGISQCQDFPKPQSCDGDDCDKLNADVRRAKEKIGGFQPAACSSGMSRGQLQARASAWLELATARAKRDQKCWAGGDDGHQQAQADAWSHLGRCQRLLQ